MKTGGRWQRRWQGNITVTWYCYKVPVVYNSPKSIIVGDVRALRQLAGHIFVHSMKLLHQVHDERKWTSAWSKLLDLPPRAILRGRHSCLRQLKGLLLKFTQNVGNGSLITDLNVCRIKTAGFGFPASLRGAPQLSKTAEKFIAEIHTKCREWVTDNRFERLPDQNCWIWLPGVTEGGVQLN